MLSFWADRQFAGGTQSFASNHLLVVHAAFAYLHPLLYFLLSPTANAEAIILDGLVQMYLYFCCHLLQTQMSY